MEARIMTFVAHCKYVHVYFKKEENKNSKNKNNQVFFFQDCTLLFRKSMYLILFTPQARKN